MLEAILLSFVRIAIGNSTSVPSTDNCDWKELMNYANRQGVSSLTFDGVVKSMEVCGKKIIPTIDCLKWSGKVIRAEDKFKEYCTVLGDFFCILEEKSLVPILLKGYGCSLNWPTPSHRPIGDVDIFSNGSRLIDEFVEQELGLIVDKHDPHHSVFSYKGITFENHHTIMDVVSRKGNAEMEGLLEQLIVEDCHSVFIDRLRIKLPSSRFYSIHLLRHLAHDFTQNRATLRQVLDWAFFVANATEKDKINWQWIYSIAKEYKMSKFLDSLNALCVEYLGFNKNIFPVFVKNDSLRDRVLNSILESSEHTVKKAKDYSNKCALVASRMKYCWENRWKYQIVFGEGAIRSFLMMSKLYWVENKDNAISQ